MCSPEDAARRADHTTSLWLDLAGGRLRLDRLRRNGFGSTFFPWAEAHSSRGKKVLPPPSSAALRPERVRRRSPSAFRSPSRPRWSRSSKTARRSDMANIGSFKKSGQEFQGEIVTLSLQTKGVRIVPETDRTNDNAPSHRVYVGRAEIGAA